MFTMDINDEHNSRIQDRWAGIHSHPVSVPINQNIIKNQDESRVQNELFQEIISSENFNPFEIFNISIKHSNLKSLRKIYRKKLLKYHPDKNNGNMVKYSVITHAYKIIKKHIMDNSFEKSDNDLRHQSKQYIQEQKKTKNIDLSSSFNINKFNEIYSKNRIPNMAQDSGRGEWLKNTKNIQFKQPNKKIIKNKKQFDKEFKKHKNKIFHKKRNELVIYKDPEPHSRGGTIKYSEIDTSRKDEFTTSDTISNNLGCTDLQKAYSEKDSLVYIGSDNRILEEKNVSLQSLQNKRKNISYQMSESEYARLHKIKKEREKKEKKRLRNIKRQDKEAKSIFNKVNKLFLGI